MEYIYAAMLLHKAGKDVDEKSLKKVLEASGVKPDGAKIKGLVSALKDIDIEDAISQAAIAPASAVAAPAEGKEEKSEKEKEEDKEKTEEEAAEGLAALFG